MTNHSSFFIIPSSFSNLYAMLTDGVNECIRMNGVISDVVGTDTTGMIGMTISMADITQNAVQVFWSITDASTTTRILLYTLTDGKLYAQCVKGGSTRWIVGTTAAHLVNNTTTFIGINHDGVEAELYVNGSKPAQSFSNSTDKLDWIRDLDALPDNCQLGCSNDTNQGDRFFAGATFDEFFWYRSSGSGAEWSEAYNGGNLLDFDTHSKGSPYNWGRMGDVGSFSTNWTLTDQGTGGHDMTTVNMEVGDRVAGLL